MIYRNTKRGKEMSKRKIAARIDYGRLARECAKLDPNFEKALAEEGLCSYGQTRKSKE